MRYGATYCFAVLTVAVLTVAGAPAWALDSDTASATAEAQLIRPLELAMSWQPLSFGDLIKGSLSGPVTITLDPNVGPYATISSSNPAEVKLAGGHMGAGFNVSGEGARSVQITVPASIVITTGDGSTTARQMTVDSFLVDVYDQTDTSLDINDDATNQFVMPADHDAVINVGGDLTVEDEDEYGAYTGSFDLTVSYL